MDFIEEIKTWLTKSHPRLYIPLAIILTIIAINDIIEKATVNKINPLNILVEFIRNQISQKIIKKYKVYNRILTDKEFLHWQVQILSKIYNQHEFPDVLNWKYPIVCFAAKEEIKYPFSEILNPEELILTAEDYKINSKVQKNYKRLIGHTIKRPLLKGYMLHKLVFNTESKLVGIQAKVSKYEQNIYTSHILEYELYKLYKKKINPVEFKSTDILNLLPFRNSIHLSSSQFEITTTGNNRHSLLGVQMFVMYLDHQDNEYKVLIIKRSNNVASKPGFFQFIPSGGFEIFQDRDDEDVLKENFSLSLALFRELLEEAFGEKEYIHNENDVPVSNIFYHDKIIQLIDLINKQKAFFEFLGSVNDLVLLRHLLAFIIRIDDPVFSRNNIFTKNYEGEHLKLRKAKDLEKNIDKGKLCNDSAGLLYLVQKNHLYIDVT